jgi:hypothetical protein
VKKIAKKVRSRAKAQAISKSRKPVAKRVPADKEAWECCRQDDMERVNQAAEGLNAESTDVLDYQTIEPPNSLPMRRNAGEGTRATQANRNIPAPNG